MKLKHIIFDWGDTLMLDDTTKETPMYLWDSVKAVEGAGHLLKELSKSHQISVATNAEQSDEQMVIEALKRVFLAQYVGRVFTSKAVGRKKGEREFWTSILDTLRAQPEEVLVVGDNFLSDVQTPSSIGITALWYNPRSEEKKESASYSTIHKLSEIITKAESVVIANA